MNSPAVKAIGAVTALLLTLGGVAVAQVHDEDALGRGPGHQIGPKTMAVEGEHEGLRWAAVAHRVSRLGWCVNVEARIGPPNGGGGCGLPSPTTDEVILVGAVTGAVANGRFEMIYGLSAPTVGAVRVTYEDRSFLDYPAGGAAEGLPWNVFVVPTSARGRNATAVAALRDDGLGKEHLIKVRFIQDLRRPATEGR